MKFISAFSAAILGQLLVLIVMYPVNAAGVTLPFPGTLLVDTAAEPVSVVNLTLEVDFEKSASIKTSRNMSVESGRISTKDAGKDAFLASSTIEAPIAFSSLGVKWSASATDKSLGLAVRTSPDSSQWSSWIEITIDEHLSDRSSRSFFSNLVGVPVDARYLQYSVLMTRTEGAPEQTELASLAFVLIKPGKTSSTLLEQLDATTEPVMLSRTAWGCPDGEESPNLNEVQTLVTHLIVHHTATSNTSADWPATVRAIWSYHAISRGWGDIGYNFLIDPLGTIYIGRAGGDNIRGAHFVCQNSGTQGIAMLGNYTSQEPTVAAINSLEELLAWLSSREEIDPAEISFHEGTRLNLFNIAGHRDGNPSAFACSTTVCPGDTFYPMLADIRDNVEVLIAESGGPAGSPQDSSLLMAFDGNEAESARCQGMIEINGEVLANIYNADFGCVLYRLDAQGNHQMLSEIDTTPVVGTAGKFPGFGLSPPFGGWYYFEGNDGFTGNRLWRTDGADVEVVNGDATWIDDGIALRRGIMNGRLYISSRNAVGDFALFSTAGRDFRREPELVVDHQSSAELVGSFYDRLLFAGSDIQHGSEPWVFDGSEYRLLDDIVSGSESSEPQSFFQLGEYWFFAGRKPGSEGEDPSVFFRTDGKVIKTLPHSGTWRGPPYDEDDLQIKTADAVYIVKDLAPLITDPPIVPTPVMRVIKAGSLEYDLGNTDADINSPSSAVLDNEALVLIGNHLYKLGEMDAEEIPLSLPSEWEQSSFEFVGSGPYFKHAYIKENGLGGDSRVWAWNEVEAGLVMADETEVITSADHFLHIGEDIYFYGEDDTNGRALRKIPDILINQLPWMGAVTGSWYDPSTSGQGFVLHTIDDNRTAINFYGFENDGTPIWLTGLGIDMLEAGRSTEITMYIASGGNFGAFNPEDIDNIPWGTLDITFNTCRKATAELDGESGKQTMNMEMLAGLEGLECYARVPPMAKTSGITGSWYDPATSGQGIVLHSISDERVVVSFYGYRDNSERLWLIGLYDGDVGVGEPLVLNMTVASGGNFGSFKPGDITRTTWGTLTIHFDDCNHATATFDGTDGQQTMNMVKLAKLNGSELGCDLH